MTTKAEIQAIARWVRQVRKHTAAGKEDVDDETMADVVEWLAREFPARLFNPESARLAAECANGFWPRWAILKAFIASYQATVAARSEQLRIGSTISQTLQAHIDEIQSNEAHRERFAERMGRVREDWLDPHKVRQSAAKILADPRKQDELGKVLARLVKQHAPANLDLLPPAWLS